MNIWDPVFDLAWESLQSGSFPVGAVLVDPSGDIAHSGRNRAFADSAPSGHLFGTRLAHAEIDALGQLMPGNYYDWTIYTSLQPCLFCLTGIRMTRVGHVVYAGADPLWDVTEQLPALLPELIASRWPRRTGPAEGFAGVFGALLPAMWLVVNSPEAVVEPSELLPWAIVETARKCVAGGVLECGSAASAYELAESLV
ncbi:nucleoside deaminase [Kribbella sp. NPDC006257]|uniref:nucleoside deaminase n=1 Tax=Kribbella sp. NPDC006257 TaxID=3156738 RepID=UPI0033A2C35A